MTRLPPADRVALLDKLDKTDDTAIVSDDPAYFAALSVDLADRLASVKRGEETAIPW